MMMTKTKVSGFTMIELMVVMILASIAILNLNSFISAFSESSKDNRRNEVIYQNLATGLSALQKIVYEKSLYITLNQDALDGNKCQRELSQQINGCDGKFSFSVDDGGSSEREYSVFFGRCTSNKSIDGRILYYTDGIKNMPLTTCLSVGDETKYPPYHSIKVLNSDLSNKVIRYTVSLGGQRLSSVIFSK